MIEAVGILELTSVGIGFLTQDAMLKAADVRVLLARTICSGKYLIAVTGRVAEVTAAVDAGVAAIPDGLIDHAVIPKIHSQVFKALGQSVELNVPHAGAGAAVMPKAVGIVETFSGASVLEGADAAAKAGQVTLLRIHLAMALGGKGYVLMAGSVFDVRAAVEAAAAVVRSRRRPQEGPARLGGHHPRPQPRTPRRVHLKKERTWDRLANRPRPAGKPVPQPSHTTLPLPPRYGPCHDPRAAGIIHSAGHNAVRGAVFPQPQEPHRADSR